MSPRPSADAAAVPDGLPESRVPPYILWPSLAACTLTVIGMAFTGQETLAAAGIGIALVAAFLRMTYRELTRHSLAFIGVGTVAYLIAWNRGVPFLYAFSAACYAIVVVAHLLPRWVLRPVRGRINCPTALLQGDRAALTVAVENPGAVSLRMVELEIPTSGAIGKDGAARALVMQLEPGATEHLSIDTPPLKRGCHTVGPITVGTGFPLGLFTKTLEVPDSARNVWVYPRLFPVEFVPVAGEQFQSMGEAISPRTGGGEDFAGVREYRRGDSRRSIHWKASARLGKLVVKEFMRTVATTVTVAVDLGRAGNVGKGVDTAVEDAIRVAGSVARYALEQRHHVQLALCGEAFQVVGPVKHVAELDRLLQALALARCDGTQSFGSHLPRVASITAPNSTAVLVYVDANAGVLAGIETMRQQGVLVVPIVVDAASYSPASEFAIDAPPHLRARARRVQRNGDLAAVFRQ